MKMKRAMMIAVLAVAVAALAVPLLGLRTHAASGANANASVAPRATAAAATNPLTVATVDQSGAVEQELAQSQGQSQIGNINPDVLKSLGIRRLPKGTDVQTASQKVAKQIAPNARIAPLPPGNGPAGASAVNAPSGGSPGKGGSGSPLIGEPLVLNELSALSSALITTIGGRDNQFSEVALIADWDGREDCVADRGAKIDDFSGVEPEIDFTLTRAAISEHTFANGHLFNSYYYGDSLGNLWFGFDLVGSPLVDAVFQANLPAIVNGGAAGSGGFVITPDTRVAGDCMDDQVTVTGIAVNPVADLGDFNPALCGVTGEVIYVSVFDSQGCASNAANQPIRSRIFAFGIFEIGGTEFVLGSVRQVLRSKFANTAGLAVDDDGSLYYQLVDLIQFTGGAIFKATEITRVSADTSGTGAGPNCGPGLRVNRVIRSIPDPPTLNSWSGTAANPAVTANGVRNTNYGRGSSTTYGNVVSLATGACNVLYAAVARSFVDGPVSFEQLTEGLFPAPSAFGAAGTPSMIISFADCSGAFDICSGRTGGAVATNIGGTLPAADGFADPAAAGGTVTPGVTVFRIFVEGEGPNLAPAAGGTAIVPGTPSSLLRIAGFQVDYTIHSGLTVSEEGTVFVISGGTPAGIGKNPSPMLGEILCFEDMCPMDRRADPVDLRGDAFPNPPASGGNVGDGDSDRFDHIFYQSPLDQVTFTPAGLAGLARGFLRYTNRLAPIAMGPGVTLGVTAPVLADDGTTENNIIFENLDPGHQVAGGDDMNTPFRGDDSDDPAGTLSYPPLAGLKEGGFEFIFNGFVPPSTPNCVWNGFFLNANGNITFGAGDPSGSFLDPPNVPAFRAGLSKIAPAWADLNPSARDINLSAFPVQALGFANVNAFKVRWINVPETGSEDCTGTTVSPGNASNTFGVTLYDDGTGIDENASQALNPANPIGNNSVAFDLQEGPTDLRFSVVPNVAGASPVGCPPRREGSGNFIFEFCRMDLLGTPDFPVITGYSIGGLDPLNPPGLCETNLSEAARAAETTFGVLVGNQTAAIGCNCLIGEGTEPTIFELFNEGSAAHIGAGGEITFATPDFDLRFEGNDAAACTSTRQRDLNRGKVSFFGIGCAPPANAICRQVLTTPAAFTAPGVNTGLVNALCAVPLNIIGCGFFPNEVTTICQGFQSSTGVPLQRPGKTVTTAATLACDTNGDGIPETVVALTNVTPVSCNLLTATIPTSASFGANTNSAFPAACCGGTGTITITTTFTEGDNNIFGPFTRTVTCSLALGTRAPVVFSVTPSNGNCAVPQDVLITGACFNINGVPNVTSVFALERGNTANRVNAIPFVIVNDNLIDAFFNFGSANAGKTFLIFVSGPNGTSRNRALAAAGDPANCTLGNEQGVQVTFTCNAINVPQTGAAVLKSYSFNPDNGVITVTGSNIMDGATVTVGTGSPKKVLFRNVETGSNTFGTLILKKKLCRLLNGAADLVVTNPGKPASNKLTVTEKCQ